MGSKIIIGPENASKTILERVAKRLIEIGANRFTPHPVELETLGHQLTLVAANMEQQPQPASFSQPIILPVQSEEDIDYEEVKRFYEFDELY